jgi:hypothetical protein
MRDRDEGRQRGRRHTREKGLGFFLGNMEKIKER